MASRKIIKTVEQRFFEKVQFADKWYERNGINTRCLEWTGCYDHSGYGSFCINGSKPQVWVGAHRWAYEHWVGPIPDGLHLDHLCRNPSCINPMHLEPVTVAENVRRGFGLESSKRRNRRSKFDPHADGLCAQKKHAWVPENIRVKKPHGANKNPTLLCRPCLNEANKPRQDRYRQRQRAKRQQGS